ncbi:unnamed protein product, partial [Closterium sp. NIES-54]
LLRSGVDIFALDYGAILAAMYALSVNAKGDCYLCVPPDPGIEAAALGASGSALPGTAPAEALHTFTLRMRWSLPPLLGGQRVSICTCTRTGRHLATFTRRPRSSLYALTTEPPQVAASAQVSASGLVAAPCSCRLLSHQTLLWHHRLGHPSMQGLRGMHSRLLVSGLPKSLPPLPPSPAPPCLPFRLQLRERFRKDLPVLRLHSDRGDEFSSDLLRDFCRGEGILHSFTLAASPQQNGVAEHRTGLVMEVARTSMIHVAAPHFLWPFAVWYAAHQLNIWPRTSSPPALFPASSLDFPLTRLAGKFTTPPRAVSSPLWTSRLTNPLSPQGPAPSHVSQVDPLPGVVPVEVAVDSGTARGAASGGAASRGAEPASAEPRGAEPKGAEPGGAESEVAESVGAEPRGAERGGITLEGVEPGGDESERAESGGAEPRGTSSAGGPAAEGAGGFAAGGIGAGGAGDVSLGGSGVTAGA